MTSATLSPELLEQIVAHIANLLSKASWPSLRRLRLEARDGTIHLEGNVTTWFEKQQAYQWVRRLAGGAPVADEIQVVSRRNTQPHYHIAGR